MPEDGIVFRHFLLDLPLVQKLTAAYSPLATG